MSLLSYELEVPKFTYEAPVLDASEAIELENILDAEVVNNYNSFNKFSNYLAHPAVLAITSLLIATTVAVVGITFNKSNPPFLISAIILSAILLVGFSVIRMFALELAAPKVFEQLKRDALEARNTAIISWATTRYGIILSSDTVSTLFNNYEIGDNLTSINDNLVRFQNIDGQGEILVDSSGTELKVLN